MAQTQLANQQQAINHRIALLDTLTKSLRLQASRATTTLARYKMQLKNDGMLANINHTEFKQVEQYNQLITKQFCRRLQQLRQNYIVLKMQMQKLVKKMQGKVQPNDHQRLAWIGTSIKQFEAKFGQIWRQEHFLVLNYKLDCTAKQLQRWTAVAQSSKNKTPQMITQLVNNMFS